MKPEILFKAYVVHQCDDAFRELVAASLDAVYSSALRIVQGTSHLAEEVSMRVYWELARKGRRLGKDVVLAAWLREHTCKTAVIVLRENNRSVDRAALKGEKKGAATPQNTQPAPPGLAFRVSQGVLLHAAGHKSFRVPFWLCPDWIRPKHVRIAAACVIVILVVSKIPFHRGHPIVRSEGVQLTPASFAQLADPDDGIAARAATVAESKTETQPTKH